MRLPKVPLEPPAVLTRQAHNLKAGCATSPRNTQKPRLHAGAFVRSAGQFGHHARLLTDYVVNDVGYKRIRQSFIGNYTR